MTVRKFTKKSLKSSCNANKAVENLFMFLMDAKLT